MDTTQQRKRAFFCIRCSKIWFSAHLIVTLQSEPRTKTDAPLFCPEADGTGTTKCSGSPPKSPLKRGTSYSGW